MQHWLSPMVEQSRKAILPIDRRHRSAPRLAVSTGNEKRWGGDGGCGRFFFQRRSKERHRHGLLYVFINHVDLLSSDDLSRSIKGTGRTRVLNKSLRTQFTSLRWPYYRRTNVIQLAWSSWSLAEEGECNFLNDNEFLDSGSCDEDSLYVTAAIYNYYLLNPLNGIDTIVRTSFYFSPVSNICMKLGTFMFFR